MARNKKLYGTKSDIDTLAKLFAIIMIVIIVPILIFIKICNLLIKEMKRKGKSRKML